VVRILGFIPSALIMNNALILTFSFFHFNYSMWQVDSDRRQDVVMLFGLLRSDGIFPSAVTTLGQYTRAIEEGYSKQSTVHANTIGDFTGYPGSSLNVDNSEEKLLLNLQVPNTLDFLDDGLVELDEGGSRWRQGRDARWREVANVKCDTDTHDQPTQPRVQNTKRRTDKEWIQLSGFSSFSPHWKPPNLLTRHSICVVTFVLFVLCHDTAAACGKCNHVLLDEDTQAGWDDDSSDGIDESLNEVKCPCCTTLVKSHIGFVEMPPHTSNVAISRMGTKVNSTNEHLPAQAQNKLSFDQSEANDETCPTLVRQICDRHWRRNSGEGETLVLESYRLLQSLVVLLPLFFTISVSNIQ